MNVYDDAENECRIIDEIDKVIEEYRESEAEDSLEELAGFGKVQPPLPRVSDSVSQIHIIMESGSKDLLTNMPPDFWMRLKKAGKEASRVLCPNAPGYRIEVCEDRLLFIPVFGHGSDDPGLPFAVSLNGEKQKLTSSETASLFWRLCNEKCLDEVTPEKAEAYYMVQRKMNSGALLTLSSMIEISRGLKAAELWFFPCTTVFLAVLEMLSEQFGSDDDLSEIMFRLLYLHSLSGLEYLWDLVFYMKLDVFIDKAGKKDWVKKLMSETAEDGFKDWV